jgi:long-subunit fatty acid transport protein
VLLVLGSRELAAQEPQEQDELDFGRLSLAIGSGARAMGMGGAFLARPDDSTAASWNPAGLSYLRVPEVSLVGVHGTQDSSTRRQQDGTLLKVTHTQGQTPDFMALALPLSLGSASGSVQLSFQRVIPYTGDRTIDLLEILLAETPRHFQIEATGGFDVVALSTGFKLAPWLRAGVSLNRWMNGFTQHRERGPSRRTEQEADFELSGWNVNAGLILHPHENVNIGIVGKTPMSGDVSLSRSREDFISDPEGGPDIVLSNAFSSDDIRLELPGAVGFGASWRASSLLTISGDYTRTFWSRSRIYNYFTLPALNAPLGSGPIVFPIRPFPNVVADTQNDTQELRLGIEYVLISQQNLKIPLRAGYVREKQYRVSRDGTSPRLDGVTMGAGLVLGPVLVDAAYVYQWGGFGPPDARDRDHLHRVLVSVIYRHGSGN